jgi:hypothetical protein
MLRAIERDILEYVAARHRGSDMREQINHVDLASRKFTGVGVYADFTLRDRESLRPIQPLPAWDSP